MTTIDPTAEARTGFTPMPEATPNPELLRSLGHLVRGLSALFWSLPAALVICFHTVKADGLLRFGIVPPFICIAVLLYGLHMLGTFQPQERIWQQTLDRARLLALINLGLSPFLYWHNRVPNAPVFVAMVILMAFAALVFLASLNLVLQRLGAMLPDEALRHEIKQFTSVNLNLLSVTGALSALYLAASQFKSVPLWLGILLETVDRASFWFLVLLVLLPMAMTMALLWKTKEVILASVFGNHHHH